MFVHMSRLFSVSGALLLTTASPVFAQCCAPIANPCNTCCQTVQVVQPCYQTVPVTEYQEVRETVRKPVYETKYVNQSVIECRPVTEQRTVEVPQVTYDTVTTCQTQYRNAGYWQTTRQPICRVSPCEYDNRPNLVGWLNRTGYSMRSAFMPKTRTNRTYIPRTVAYQVPVTRQVARHTTRKVSYNVTRMVSKKVNRRVAVRTLRWDTKVVTRKVPRTVFRQVPIGSTIAYGGSTTTAGLTPQSDPISRSASSDNHKFKDEDDRYENSIDDDGFEAGDPDALEKGASLYKPIRKRQASTVSTKTKKRKRSLPTVVRINGWKKSNIKTRSVGKPVNIQDGPKLLTPQMASLNP